MYCCKFQKRWPIRRDFVVVRETCSLVPTRRREWNICPPTWRSTRGATLLTLRVSFSFRFCLLVPLKLRISNFYGTKKFCSSRQIFIAYSTIFYFKNKKLFSYEMHIREGRMRSFLEPAYNRDLQPA